MLLRKVNSFINNLDLSIIYYSYLLFIPFATLFNNPIKVIYSLFCITIFLLKKNGLPNIKKHDLIPISIELLCISYSFYYVPKSFKYLISIIIFYLVYHKFIKNREDFFSKINFSHISIIFLLFFFPLINTSLNDIFTYQYFKLGGYIEILRNLVLLFVGIYTFNNYKNIEIIIRPLFISSLMHTIINIAIKLKLTDFNYLTTRAFYFTYGNYDNNSLFFGNFSTNIILLFTIPAIYYLYKKKYLYFTISYAGLALSGSRTGATILTLALFIYILEKINLKQFISKRSLKLVLLLTSLIIFFSYSTFFRELFNLFKLNSLNTNGIDIRLGYIDYFLENISLPRKLFGYGNNAYIYNSYHQIFAKTEISQLNFVYYNGIIVGLFGFVTYLRLIIINLKSSLSTKISQSDFKILSIALIYIFIIAGSQELLTHPILIFIFIFLSSNDSNLIFYGSKDEN